MVSPNARLSCSLCLHVCSTSSHEHSIILRPIPCRPYLSRSKDFDHNLRCQKWHRVCFRFVVDTGPPTTLESSEGSKVAVRSPRVGRRPHALATTAVTRFVFHLLGFCRESPARIRSYAFRGDPIWRQHRLEPAR